MPILPLAAGLACGIIIANLLAANAVLATAIAMAIVGVALWCTPQKWLGAAVVAAAVGIADVYIQQPHIPQGYYDDGGVHVVTVDYARASGTGVTLIDATDARWHLPLRIVVGTDITHLVQVDDTIAFRGAIAPLVAGHTDVPLQFDYDQHLLRHGFVGRSFISNADRLVVRPRHDATLARWLVGLRHRCENMLFDSQLNDATSSFLAAIMLGDRQAVDYDSRQAFTTTGLAHTLALSGLHVGIITTLILIILMPVRLYDHRRLVVPLVTIAALWAYATITGMAFSVTRAVIMATIMFLAYMCGRLHSSWNALLTAAMVILFVSPAALFQADFQMTFAAVAAILALSRPLNPWADTRRRLLATVAALFAVAIAATLGTALISAIYFHCFPTYFLLANVATVWILPLMLGGALLLLLLSALGLPALWLCQALNGLHGVVTAIVSAISGWPAASIPIDDFSAWHLVPWALAVALLSIALHYRRPRLGVAAGAIMAVVAVAIAAPWRQYAPSEAYLPHHSQSTDVLVRRSHGLTVHTTMRPFDANLKRKEIADRYRHYLATRQVDTIIVTVQPFVATPAANYLLVCADSVAIPADTAVRIHKLVICKGFTGNPLEVASRLRPDSVILSADLNIRRARRYADSLQCHSVPFRLMLK